MDKVVPIKIKTMANNEKDQLGSENQNDRNENQNDAGKKTGRTGTSNRGFASMDAARHREISAMGGRASHESGRGHEFDSEEARAAGRKGGQASHGGRGANAGPSASARERNPENSGRKGGMEDENMQQ